MLMVEGLMILSCLIAALHFADGTWQAITESGLFTFAIGLFGMVRYSGARTMRDRRLAYLLVVLMWVVLALFGTLPFLATACMPVPLPVTWSLEMSSKFQIACLF